MFFKCFWLNLLIGCPCLLIRRFPIFCACKKPRSCVDNSLQTMGEKFPVKEPISFPETEENSCTKIMFNSCMSVTISSSVSLYGPPGKHEHLLP